MRLGALIRLVPRSALVARLCRSYIAWCNGENNADQGTNGELRFLRLNLQSCHTVFDVGANVGDWSAAALRINPGLTIHCFEPNKAAFDELAARRFPPSVTRNQLALGARPGSATLYASPDRSSLSSFYRRRTLEGERGGDELRPRQVAVTTVDQYCAEKGIEGIDLVKVDVEGHEVQVMAGMSRMLVEHRVKLLQFEYGATYIDSHALLKDAFDLLGSHEYCLWKILPREIRPIGEYSWKLENFNYQNWVASALGFRLLT